MLGLLKLDGKRRAEEMTAHEPIISDRGEPGMQAAPGTNSSLKDQSTHIERVLKQDPSKDSDHNHNLDMVCGLGDADRENISESYTYPMANFGMRMI